MTRKVFKRGRDGISPISQQNTTSELLPAGGVFTGGVDDVSDMSTAAVYIVASTSGKVKFQVSADSVAWDDLSELEVGTSDAVSLEVPIPAQYFRVVYTNGGRSQTAFLLQVIYHDRAPRSLLPEQATAVRLSNGEGFESIAELAYELKLLRAAVDEGNRARKITNFHLSIITGEQLEDI